MRKEQEKLTKDLTELQAQLESETRQVDQLLDDKVRQLKEVVMDCPPVLVTIPTPEDSNVRLNLDRDSEQPWISSCFYSHPGGYKLCLALKATNIDKEPWIRLTQTWGPGTCNIQYVRKPKLFISVVAVSQKGDDCRTWPCEGEVTLTLRLLDGRKGDPFTTTFSIVKSTIIQPDTEIAMNEIKDWVPLSKEAIPFGQTHYPGSGNPLPNIAPFHLDFGFNSGDDILSCPLGTIPFRANSIPSDKLHISIETVVLSEKSKVWNSS